MINHVIITIFLVLTLNISSFGQMNMYGPMNRYMGNKNSCNMRPFGYSKSFSKYGQRFAVKNKKQAILYVKNFYRENGYPNIKILMIHERPHFFKMHVISRNGKRNDMIVLIKSDGRIRFMKHHMQNSCPNDLPN